MPAAGRRSSAWQWQGAARLRFALLSLLLVVVVGTAGYVALGFGPLDALYQTVTTITTVGFREVEPLDATGQWFTLGLIVVGVGIALYTFGVVLESVVEGGLRSARERRRMQHRIDELRDHVVVCGWGRVGRAITELVEAAGREVVVVDQDEERLESVPGNWVHGDATDDDVLRAAGIERARVLVAAIGTDAENLYVTLSGRSLRGDLFIIARARDESSSAKLLRAGADRVVNPQALGGARMASFVLQPNVAEFVDVVMHEGNVEFRLAEVAIVPGSPLAGRTLDESEVRRATGALVLAVRDADGRFLSNPPPGTVLEPGSVLIAIGTPAELEALDRLSRAS